MSLGNTATLPLRQVGLVVTNDCVHSEYRHHHLHTCRVVPLNDFMQGKLRHTIFKGEPTLKIFQKIWSFSSFCGEGFIQHDKEPKHISKLPKKTREDQEWPTVIYFPPQPHNKIHLWGTWRLRKPNIPVIISSSWEVRAEVTWVFRFCITLVECCCLENKSWGNQICILFTITAPFTLNWYWHFWWEMLYWL